MLCHLGLLGLPLISVDSNCKSQTTEWRWTQPAHSSLLPSVFLTVSLTPHCLPWFFSPLLPLTSDSRLGSNAKRMRIGLSSYLTQHTLEYEPNRAVDGLTATAHFHHRAERGNQSRVKHNKRKRAMGCLFFLQGAAGSCVGLLSHCDPFHSTSSFYASA